MMTWRRRGGDVQTRLGKRSRPSCDGTLAQPPVSAGCHHVDRVAPCSRDRELGLRSSVAGPVVEVAGRPAVVLCGGAIGGVGLDVVDLTVVGRCVAELVEALAVAYLHGSAGCASEE